jgi:photosystem II stability/assembly factor-like uncharacterized protein
MQSQLNFIYYAQAAESYNVVGGTSIKIEKKYTISPAIVPISTEMMAITYGNNVFVAVGRFGRILSSPDGKIWTEQIFNINKTLNRVIYGNELFVIIGEEGIILTSPVGAIWSNQIFSQTYNCVNIIYANGMFVIVGSGGTIVTSSNGINWEERTSTVSDKLSSIAYGKEIFVCSGYYGIILTSHDGSTWTQATTNTTGSFHKVVYGNEMFEAIGANGIFTSQDGFNWELRKSGEVSEITYGDYKFVALQGTDTLTSSDGITWHSGSKSGTATWYDVAYGNNLYVAVGNNPNPTIITSPDGHNWFTQTIDFSAPLNIVLFSENENNMFVIMGAGKIYAFTINIVIGLNNISDLTAVNNKIDNLTTLKLTHLAQVNSTLENLSTCIENLKVGLQSTKNIIFTRPGFEPIDKHPEKKFI